MLILETKETKASERKTREAFSHQASLPKPNVFDCPAKNATLFFGEFSLCLSRACLGIMMHLHSNGAKMAVFAPRIEPVQLTLSPKFDTAAIPEQKKGNRFNLSDLLPFCPEPVLAS